MNSDFAASFNRSPDWKWKRAQSIVSGSGPAATPFWDTENGCQWIRRAEAFLQSLAREEDPVINNELIIMYGDIYTAWSIYTDTSSNYRFELEGMILARVEREELAVRIDIPIAAITAFEELFFDVRGKLESESYILNYVIGPDIQRLKESNVGALWKLFGYYQGPEVLRAVISRTVNPTFAMTPDAVGARLNEDIAGSFKISCAIAAKKAGGGNMADRQLLQLFAKVMEVDKMEDLSSGSSKGQIAEHIQAMLGTLGLSVGGIPKTNPLSDYKHKPVEPQFHELVSLTLTGEAESLKEAADFKFPIPTNRGLPTAKD
ncbi:MAG: hypothetical protein IJV70_01515 [Clostridia bacterium]|nr:hypothetical protein [Clostridia bacterium]